MSEAAVDAPEEHVCLSCENCFHCCCPREPAPMPKVGSFLVCQQCDFPMRVRSTIDRVLWLEEIEMGDITRVPDDCWPILREMLWVYIVRLMWARSLWKAIFARFAVVYMTVTQHRWIRRMTRRTNHWELRRIELPKSNKKLPFGKYTDDGLFEAWFPVEQCFAGIDMHTERGDTVTIKTLACEGKAVPPQTYFIDAQPATSLDCHGCAMPLDAHWHMSHCELGPNQPCDIDHPVD